MAKRIDYTPEDDFERESHDDYNAICTTLDAALAGAKRTFSFENDKAWRKYTAQIRKHRKAKTEAK